MKKLLLLTLVLMLAGCGKEEVNYQGKGAAFWIAQLKDKDPSNRQEAIKALQQIGQDAVPPLIGALRDENSIVRIAAADSLGRIGPEARAAIAPLREALKDDDRSVRRHAAFALGVVDPDNQSVIPALIEALKDNDKEVRRHAAVALGRIGPGAKTAVSALVGAMKDDEGSYRWIYRNALEAINEEVMPSGT
jgi:HEAT repeat protein